MGFMNYMKTGIRFLLKIINSISSLNVKKDTTLALIQAALQVQHQVYLIEFFF